MFVVWTRRGSNSAEGKYPAQGWGEDGISLIIPALERVVRAERNSWAADRVLAAVRDVTRLLMPGQEGKPEQLVRVISSLSIIIIFFSLLPKLIGEWMDEL